MFYILTRLNFNLLNLAVVLIYPFYSMIYKIKISLKNFVFRLHYYT